MRASNGRTTANMTRQKASASPTVSSTSRAEPATAIAVASAIKNQAVTSSTAADAITTAPSGRFSIRRSTRILASTGNAVIDIETPMNRAKGRKSPSGATRAKTGTAAAIPSIIGTATLAFEISAAWATRPRSWRQSSSSPTRNM
jgi:hypothetical protein